MSVPERHRTPQLTGDEIADRLAQVRVLPIATLDASVAQEVGWALMDAGISCLEITLRAPGAVEAIRAATRVPGLLVGAGTILSAEQARAAAEAGAAFAVSPGLSEDVLAQCQAERLPLFPGVATPTEIERARQLGLRTLKVFPIGCLGGPAFLSAVSATYPDVRFIPTGGVDASNLADYLALPSVLACGGSWLVDRRLVAEHAFDELARRAREALELVG